MTTAPGQKVTIPYGDSEVVFETGTAEVIAELGLAAVPPLLNPETRLKGLLRRPIGCRPLKELAVGAQRVVIVSDDATRPTPVSVLLPPVLSELAAAGVPKSGITFVMANGSHRAMTGDEITLKIGSEIASQFRVINHDHREADLVDMGRTPSGIPIHVNRWVAEADLVVGLGSIVPHRYCGWSGGAKIIQPGVCGEETTVTTHLMITRDPGVRMGNVENVVRHEMEAVAERAGLKFIVNTVLNAGGQVVDVVAGHPVASHRMGVQIAMAVCSSTVPCRAEVVVAGSHPANANFWQAGKSLYSADLVCTPDGTIILVTPSYEGIGEHKEFGALMALEYDEILRRLESGRVHDRLSAAGALAVRLVARGRHVIVVTDGLTDAEVAEMGFVRYPVARLQDAVDDALRRYSGARLMALKEAPDILPVVAEH